MQFNLPVQRFILSFDAPAGRVMPTFAGNVWRGAFGHALRAAACLTGAPQCTGCTRKPQCAFAYVFDTPPPADATAMRLYPNAPHPFVLRELPAVTGAAATAELMLTLIGRAQRLLPLIVEALRAAAAGPGGIAGWQLTLRAVRQEARLGHEDWQRIDAANGALNALPATPCEPPPAPGSARSDAIRLELVTPLRVKREGRSLGPGALTFGDVFGSLMRRVSMLCTFHGDALLAVPFAELAGLSRQVRMRAALSSVRQQRFSNRQHQSMPMDGVVGWIEIDASVATVYWPFLWLGQYVHTGSAATMGLGCYALVARPAEAGFTDQPRPDAQTSASLPTVSEPA